MEPPVSGNVRIQLERWAALLLSAATVATAYSAYESTRWSGEQSTKFTQAGATRTQSAKAEGRGNSLQTFDAAIFSEYSTALAEDRATTKKALFGQFRDEFKPAYFEWLQDSAHPEISPFVRPSYKVSEYAKATELDAEADRLFELGRAANQNSDNYVLSTIFFATVLFFAGIAGTFHREQVVRIMLGFGTLVFVAGLIRVATLPFH